MSERGTVARKLTPWAGLAFLAILCYSIMGDYGLSWDEPTRWRSGDVKIEYYNQLWQSQSKWEAMQKAPNDLYPGLFDITLGLARHNTSINPILLSRIWNVSFGLLCVAGTFVLARLSLASFRRAAVFKDWIRLLLPLASALFLVLVPEYFGHMFINPKDIPFAATYVWALCSLVNLVRAFPRPSWTSVALFGVATGLCMATRPPGIVIFGYAGLAFLVYLFLSKKTEGWRRDALRLLGQGGVALLIAVVTVVPWWPAMHRNPFTTSVAAVERLHTFSQEIPLLFGGTMYTAGTAPYGYAIWMFLIKMPEWLLLLLAIGLVLAIRNRKSIGNAFRERPAGTIGCGVIAFAAVFPMLYVLVERPAIHNGFRHLLYVLPPVAIMAAWSLFAIAEAAARLSSGVQRILMAAFAGCVAYSVYVLVALYPYQYVYYNTLVGGPSGALSRYETEYWFTSGRESVATIRNALRETGRDPDTIPLKVMVSGPWQAIEPYLPKAWTLVGNAENADIFIGNTQMRSDLLVDGDELARIERMGLPIVIIKSVARRR